MKWKTTFALFLVVVVLSALVYFFDGRKSDEGFSTRNKSQIKLKLPSEKINKLEIIYGSTGAATLTLTKDENGVWQSSPIKTDSETIDRFVLRLSKRFVFFKVANPGIISEYGLENPRITTTFYLDDGTSKTIKIGDEIPTGNYVYMSVDEMPNDVFYIVSGIVNDFSEFARKQLEGNEGA